MTDEERMFVVAWERANRQRRGHSHSLTGLRRTASFSGRLCQASKHRTIIVVSRFSPIWMAKGIIVHKDGTKAPSAAHRLLLIE